MDEQLGKVILEAFNQRTGGRKLICSLCGGTRWGIDGIAGIPLQDKLGIRVIGGKGLPLASLTCEICGNTLFLNAIRLLGRKRFDEIVGQQKEAGEAIEEAQKIVKEGGSQSEEGKT